MVCVSSQVGKRVVIRGFILTIKTCLKVLRFKTVCLQFFPLPCAGISNVILSLCHEIV